MERGRAAAERTFHATQERILECSDNYRMFTCKECGMPAHVNPERRIAFCKGCKNILNFAEIRLPYSCKQLFLEMEPMGIRVKVVT